jgi:hypothetical protein
MNGGACHKSCYLLLLLLLLLLLFCTRRMKAVASSLCINKGENKILKKDYLD